MGQTAKPTRQNRTITVDFHDETTYFAAPGRHQGVCRVRPRLSPLPRLSAHTTRPAVSGGGCLTRHSHYARVRLGGLTIWRIQCTTCKAVFTVLPHFVLRYRTMRPEVARDALLATHGGLSLELVCGHLPYLPHGPLSLDLCLWPTQPGHRADPVWPAAADVYPGR